MSLVRIRKRSLPEFIPHIRALEESAEYPIGDDYFKIDHGSDYFAFFERLGALRYYAWIRNERISAVGAAVLRKVPTLEKGRAYRHAWYLCDLKVDQALRGRYLSLRLMNRGFLWNYLRCRRGYAISMNPSDQKPNRVARLLTHFRKASLKEMGQLLFWSLDKSSFTKIEPVVNRHRGPTSYLSLQGVKDIVLRSTQSPMPLRHVQFGPLADPLAIQDKEPHTNYMFCSPAADPLTQELESLGVHPSSSATIIAHRMEFSNWTWLLTSDI